LSHGATGKGNDQVRFELCALALDATIQTLAPWREKEFIEQFKGRQDLLNYAAAHNIQVRKGGRKRRGARVHLVLIRCGRLFFSSKG